MYTRTLGALGASSYADSFAVPSHPRTVRRDKATGRFARQTRQWRRAQLRGLGFNPLAFASSVLPGGGGPGRSGAMPGMPGGDSRSSTTVSPAIQTTITPTISPNFTQVQDSAGARTASSTRADVPTTQTADTRGASMPASPSMPGSAMPGIPALSTFPPLPSATTRRPVVQTDVRESPETGVFDAVFRDGTEGDFPWTPVLGIAAAAAVAIAYFRRDK